MTNGHGHDEKLVVLPKRINKRLVEASLNQMLAHFHRNPMIPSELIDEPELRTTWNEGAIEYQLTIRFRTEESRQASRA
jgi:hypothetical protein